MTSLRVLACALIIEGVIAQSLRPRPSPQPATQQQAPKGAGVRYSSFLHSSEKHKGLACNACHKIPTARTAKRDFPDVADFPDHDSCVRCHRRQFFTRQAFSGTGPIICTVCHPRAAPGEDARFAFGKPNNSNQTFKAKAERQFTIEFPHDKHQNVIALLMTGAQPSQLQRTVPAGTVALQSRLRITVTNASFSAPLEDQKPDYNNCTICHLTNMNANTGPPPGWADSVVPSAGTFKAMPHSHDACFNCHWTNQKPSGADCGGCHKPAATFEPGNFPRRISAKFSHEGGKGEHVMECTTCHINITRAVSLRGLTPDVPVAACTTCHRDSKKTTYPKAVTIEEEFEQNKKTGACTYCHSTDVGKKKAPASHDAAAK